MFYLSKKLIYSVIVVVAFFCASCGDAEKPLPYAGFRPLDNEAVMSDPALWGELNVHDPAIIKEGNWYYVFSTDASLGNRHPLGVQIRRSKDLITWEYRGAAFADFEKDCAEPIEYAGLDPKKKEGLWAPDVVKHRGRYRLYFSASTFGSSRSCIALAEAKNIEGPYTYRGMVVKSRSGDGGPNAIDPAIVYDTEGRPCMAWGSFFGGIFIAPLNPKTGFFEGAKPQKIAGGSHAAVEGAALFHAKETGYYYLFVSYGSLSRNYNIRVARSKNIGGPYLDAAGMSMTDAAAVASGRAGTKLMGGCSFVPEDEARAFKGYKAPGHNSILVDKSGGFMVHHVRSYNLPDYWFHMNVRRFVINRFGWPVPAPHRYYGEQPEEIALPHGIYGVIEHLADSNSGAHFPQELALRDGAVSGAGEGSWRIYDGYRMELVLDGVLYDGFALKQYDWEQERSVHTFSVMSEEGKVLWGFR